MELRDSRVYYGVCTTAPTEETKEVSIYNPTFIEREGQRYLDLEIGDKLIVSFTQGNKASNPTLLLSIKDTSQNITISNDSQSGTVITGGGDSINWKTDVIVSFIFVYRGIYGDDSSGQTVTTYVKKWKIDNRTKVANEEFNGLVRIVTDLSQVTSAAKDYTALAAPLVQNLISTAASNIGITSVKNGSTGERKITLSTNNKSKEFILPNIPASTKELSNNGESGDSNDNGNEKFLTNNRNIAFLSPDLGVGYRYWVKENGVPVAKVLRGITPYSLNDNGTTNSVSIGYDALKHYQLGTKNTDGKAVSIDPWVLISGKNIRLYFDKSGELAIGQRDIPNNTYDRFYHFTPKSVTFDNPLTVNGRIYCKGITFTEIGKTTGEFINQKIDDALVRETASTKVMTYGGNTSIPDKNSYQISTGSAHLRIKVNKKDYRAIGLAGFDIDPEKDYDSTHMLLFECFLNNVDGVDYVYFGLRNLSSKKQKITFNVKVLYVYDKN